MAFSTEIMTDVEVKELAIHDNNFDEAYFTNYILTSQRKYVRSTLGKDYYNEILDQIENATLTADNTIIVDSFLKPMLAHFVVYECYSRVHTQTSNQGTMNNYTEYSNQSNSFDYSQSRDFYINKGDTWRKDMITYIEEAKDDDSTKYPLFDTCEGQPQLNKKGIQFY